MSQQTFKNYINGRWENGVTTGISENPSDLADVVGEYSRADASQPWVKFPVQMDVTGYHHNTAGGFASLRPALYAAGSGDARFSALRYRALDQETLR